MTPEQDDWKGAPEYIDPAIEVERLRKINVQLVTDFNAMNQHGAKQDARIAALEAQVKAADGFAEFSQAVVDRWDSRDWRSGHTVDFIESQRKALATYRAAKGGQL